jgi:hypothetical protein
VTHRNPNGRYERTSLLALFNPIVSPPLGDLLPSGFYTVPSSLPALPGMPGLDQAVDARDQAIATLRRFEGLAEPYKIVSKTVHSKGRAPREVRNVPEPAFIGCACAA